MDLTTAIRDRRTLEFRLGTSLLRESQRGWLTATIALVYFAIMLAVFSDAHVSKLPVVLGALWSAWLHKIAAHPGSIWRLKLLAILVVLMVLVRLVQRRAYLRLTDSGLEYYVPPWTGLAPMGYPPGHRRIPWSSIRAASLLPAPRSRQRGVERLARYRLVLETDSGALRFTPFFWMLRGGPDHRLTFWQTRLPSKLDSQALVDTTPLIQALRARGIDIAAATDDLARERGPAGYDLAKSPGLIFEILLFFAAGLYLLVDGFIIHAYKPLEALPLLPFALMTLAGTALVATLGRGAPALERSVIGVLTVAALAGAVYPGLLRVNAMTANPQRAMYRSVAPGRFEPVKAALPTVDLRSLHMARYWAQYPRGAKYKFVLLRGVCGFYELDMGPVYASTRNFYANRRRGH